MWLNSYLVSNKIWMLNICPCIYPNLRYLGYRIRTVMSWTARQNLSQNTSTIYLGKPGWASNKDYSHNTILSVHNTKSNRFLKNYYNLHYRGAQNISIIPTIWRNIRPLSLLQNVGCSTFDCPNSYKLQSRYPTLEYWDKRRVGT